MKEGAGYMLVGVITGSITMGSIYTIPIGYLVLSAGSFFMGAVLYCNK